MNRASVVITLTFLPVAALAQENAISWHHSNRSMYDFVQDGFELKFVLDEPYAPEAVLSGREIGTTFYLQKAGALVSCFSLSRADPKANGGRKNVGGCDELSKP